MRQRFSKTTGLVTGAAGLLGELVTRALINEGARVIAADLPGEKLERLKQDFGDQIECVPTDVTDEEQVKSLFNTALTLNKSPLSFVFNNAGIEGPVKEIRNLDISELRRVLEINVVGTAIVLKYALQAVTNGARIVQSGSTASMAGAAGLGPYVVSKHGVLGLTRTASREEADRGIRINALLPGPIKGPMMARIASGRQDTASNHSTSNEGVLDGGRQADPEEIVAAALFLLSEDASFMTGTGLLVDGGRNA